MSNIKFTHYKTTFMFHFKFKDMALRYEIDRAERYDLKSRLWLFFSPFLFPPKKEGRRKEE